MAVPQPDVESWSCDFRNTVVVTGFGPFEGHTVNASWEAVNLLPSTRIEDDLGICLVVEQLPVSYEEVETKIPMLWKTHNPLLVMHVGVSKEAKKIMLEKVAEKCGYKRLDICGYKPSTNECSLGTCPILYSALNINELSKEINCTSVVQTCTSEKAGRYLCEYTYYSSLSIDCTRSLFIHVPPLNQPYTAEQLAAGLSDIIRSLVRELKSKPQDAAMLI